MLNNQVGNAEIVSYRTTRFDPPYKYPLNGIFTGTSVSHIALKLTFNNKELFERYIAGNKNIPYNKNIINTKNGERLYEIYFSFWPEDPSSFENSSSQLKNMSFEHTGSQLKDNKFDREQSALGSPMTYNPKYVDYISPDKKTVSTLIPFFENFFHHQITLPPSIILHTTRLENITKYNKEIIEKVKNYSIQYENWCDSLLDYQNAKKSWGSSTLKTRRLEIATKKANATLLSSKEELKADIKSILSHDKNFTEAQFMKELDEFITFGKPAIDTIILPLVHKNNDLKNSGLEIEPMLKLIKDIGDNPKNYIYNISTLNCATLVQSLLSAGAQDPTNKKIHSKLAMPWYIRWLNLPVSPAMVMSSASKVLKVPGIIPTVSINTAPITNPKLHLIKNIELDKYNKKEEETLSASPPILTLYRNTQSTNDSTQPLSRKNKQSPRVNINIKKNI